MDGRFKRAEQHRVLSAPLIKDPYVLAFVPRQMMNRIAEYAEELRDHRINRITELLWQCEPPSACVVRANDRCCGAGFCAMRYFSPSGMTTN